MKPTNNIIILVVLTTLQQILNAAAIVDIFEWDLNVATTFFFQLHKPEDCEALKTAAEDYKHEITLGHQASYYPVK